MLRLSELVRSYEAHTGEIEVVGWIKTARESKNVGFIELGDGSCFKNVQVVYETNNINPNITKQLNTGTAIGVKGELVLTPEMQQPFEIRAREIEILGECDGDYPLQKKSTALNTCAQFSTLGPARTCSRRRSGCAALWRRPYTASLTSAASFMCIPRSSPRATARARAKCSA